MLRFLCRDLLLLVDTGSIPRITQSRAQSSCSTKPIRLHHSSGSGFSCNKDKLAPPPHPKAFHKQLHPQSTFSKKQLSGNFGKSNCDSSGVMSSNLLASRRSAISASSVGHGRVGGRSAPGVALCRTKHIESVVCEKSMARYEHCHYSLLSVTANFLTPLIVC